MEPWGAGLTEEEPSIEEAGPEDKIGDKTNQNN